MILLKDIKDTEWFEYGDYVYAKVTTCEGGKIRCYNTTRGRMEYLHPDTEVKVHVRFR